ncbi:M17 family metallopeptidase, partial [Patescibacteria group bacterium]
PGISSKILLYHMGSIKKYSSKKARIVGANFGKIAQKNKVIELNITILEEMNEFLQELLEGILLTQYKPDKFKTKKKKTEKNELERINLIAEKKTKKFGKAIEKADLIAIGVDYIKDLVNKPSNVIDGEYLAGEARRIAKSNRYKVLDLKEKDLKKMKWGGLLAVNQGAEKEAKCIILEHNGGPKKERPIVIVGKGVIFDSGGYNIKPTKYIETMHQDMGGAAIVMGLFEVMKDLGIKKNVIGVMPIAENLVSDRAYRPSDVITMYSGKTVEITNTDAEGRLILADAMTYAAKFKPESIITIATLTGAVSVATGCRYSGLIGNDIKLRRSLQKAGKKVDDLGWPLPLHQDYKKKMNSEIADIRNCDIGSSSDAGSSKGAAFLERFIEKNKWCHIDIGGTAFTSDPKPYQTKGATAHGFRMLLEYLSS